MKRILSALLILAMLLSALGAAAAAEEENPWKDLDLSEYKEINMIIPGNEPPAFAEIMGTVNARMKELINTTVNIDFVSYADFGTKLSLFLNGDDYDLVYGAYWFNFGDYVNLYCYGHVAILTVVKEVVLNGSWASADICTLPEGYRPQYDLYAAATLQDISTGNFTLYIQPDGKVQAKVRGGTSPGSSAHFVMGTLVWSY